VTPEIAAQRHLPNDNGVEIAMVDQDGPAGKAGLKEHDVIVKFNDKAVADPFELRNLIRQTTPETMVTLGVIRDGRPVDVKVKLAGRPEWNGEIHIPKIVIPPMPEIDVPAVILGSRRNGVTIEPLTRQLAEAFGSKDGHGVLIRSVDKNSPAELAGFRAGDVIVRVGNQTIDDVSDWNQAMRRGSAAKVNVTVIREKREQNFTLALPDKRNEGSAVYFPGEDIDLSGMQAEMAKIGPEVEKSVAEAQKEWAKTWNNPEFHKQIEDAQREARKAMQMNTAELRKQMEQARRDAEKAAKEWEKQSQEWQKQWQNDNED
jgi:serine protease Do